MTPVDLLLIAFGLCAAGWATTLVCLVRATSRPAPRRPRQRTRREHHVPAHSVPGPVHDDQTRVDLLRGTLPGRSTILFQPGRSDGGPR